MKRLAILTSSEIPNLTEDDALLVPAFFKFGVEARPLVWSEDELAQWDAVLVRSTWDYHLNSEKFAAWLEKRRETRFFNDRRLIHWNIHKKYLLELSQQGVSIVDTVLLPKDSPHELAARWSELIIKPAISASAFQTRRVKNPMSREDRAWLTAELRERDMLIQPFFASIATRGEVSIVAIGGEVTHAYIKRPSSGDFRVQSDYGGSTQPIKIESWHRQCASQILRAAISAAGVEEPPAYARIDLIFDSRGEWRLSELELIEPGLNFAFAPESAERLAQYVAARL